MFSNISESDKSLYTATEVKISITASLVTSLTEHKTVQLWHKELEVQDSSLGLKPVHVSDTTHHSCKGQPQFIPKQPCSLDLFVKKGTPMITKKFQSLQFAGLSRVSDETNNATFRKFKHVCYTDRNQKN